MSDPKPWPPTLGELIRAKATEDAPRPRAPRPPARPSRGPAERPALRPLEGPRPGPKATT
jgi:hypothetical protein